MVFDRMDEEGFLNTLLRTAIAIEPDSLDIGK